MKTLNEMTVKELRTFAKDKNLKIAKMYELKKDELIEAINAEIVKAEEKCFDSEAGGFSPDMMAEAFELENSRTDYGTSSEVEESKTEESESSDNGIQKIAKKQLENAYNNFIGSLENELQDNEEDSEEYQYAYKILHGDPEYIVDSVYSDALTCEFDVGYQGGYGTAPKEMKFASKKFCLDFLRELIKRDGYGSKQERATVVAYVPIIVTRTYKGKVKTYYKCPVCGHITSNPDNFCIHCGARLNYTEGLKEGARSFVTSNMRPEGNVEPKIISKYGKTHHYCPTCGNRVDWESDQVCCHECGQRIANPKGQEFKGE